MSTLGQPVPPKPDVFTPDGVPPGITWNPLPVDRPALDAPARQVLVHTNAGEFRSSMGGQRSYALAAADNTKPTYLIGLDDHDGAEKWLRSDQRAIANGTVVPGMADWSTLTAQQQGEILQHGRDATFSLAIESIDLGWANGIGDFSDYQGERVALALAYETLVPGNEIVLFAPTTWYGAGVGGHTTPFEYPFWTIYKGKTCPGPQKKASLFGWVLPRAREILVAWTQEEPPPPVPDPDEVESDMAWRVAKLLNPDGSVGSFYIGNGVKSHTVGDIGGFDISNDEAALRMATGAVNTVRVTWDGATDDNAGPSIVTSFDQVRTTMRKINLRRYVGSHPTLA